MRRDRERRMPGFAAEAALSAPAGTYRPPRGAGRAPAGAPITPQSRPEFLCRAACWLCGGFNAFCGVCSWCYDYHGS